PSRLGSRVASALSDFGDNVEQRLGQIRAMENFTNFPQFRRKWGDGAPRAMNSRCASRATENATETKSLAAMNLTTRRTSLGRTVPRTDIETIRDRRQSWPISPIVVSRGAAAG